MIRFATRIFGPSSAALVLRLTQLLVLVCLSNLSSGMLQASMLASFGILSAFGVMADSGAVNFILSSRAGDISREEFVRVVGIHATIAAAGAAGAFAYCLLLFGYALGDAIWLVLALAVSQAVESLLRVVRSPLLVSGLDGRFALADLSLALVKMIIIGCAFIAGSLSILVAMPFAAAVVAFVFWRRGAAIYGPGPIRKSLFRKVIRFGAAGAGSALYSQSPLVLGGMILSIQATAALAVAYRITQPTEIVAATLSQQATPRLVSGTLRALPLWSGLLCLGLAVSVGIFFTRDTIEAVLSLQFRPLAVLLIVIAAVPVKFGNYALTAVAYASGRVMGKLVVTLVVGAIAVVSTMVAAPIGTPEAVAAVTLGAEVLLAGGLCVMLNLKRRPS